MDQTLFFTNSVCQALDHGADAIPHRGAFILVDSNTRSCALPLLEGSEVAKSAAVITVPAGDANKNAEQLSAVWKQLSDGGASRHSLLINLGGGMVTDLGGFAAATFKRGMPFINIPTTLLGAVDAAVGGKTGINFNGLKNEVGAFAPANAVIISTLFFSTLPRQELLSGYAEMIKHALLKSPRAFGDLMAYDISEESAHSDALLAMVEQSVGVKQEVVAADPSETGLRKCLNLGHTVGHAFESYAANTLRRPIPHGYAVAYGLIASLILSHMQLGMPTAPLSTLAAYVRENYGAFCINCDMYPALLELMHHDKKNEHGSTVSFTLLSGIGAPLINQECDDKTIAAALDIYRDLTD